MSQVEAFIPKEFANYTHTLTQRKSLIVLTILEESVDPMLLVNTWVSGCPKMESLRMLKWRRLGGWVCQTSLAYELCNRNLVYELRLPLSLPKNLSKQVSENSIESNQPKTQFVLTLRSSRF